MNRRLKKSICIQVDESEKMQLAEKIHNQLVGNKDYKESNIILNCDFSETIVIHFFKECKDIPEITI